MLARLRLRRSPGLRLRVEYGLRDRERERERVTERDVPRYFGDGERVPMRRPDTRASFPRSFSPWGPCAECPDRRVLGLPADSVGLTPATSGGAPRPDGPGGVTPGAGGPDWASGAHSDVADANGGGGGGTADEGGAAGEASGVAAGVSSVGACFPAADDITRYYLQYPIPY